MNVLSAQSEVRVTIHLENASLQKLISAVEEQTSYRFVYTNEQLQESKPVTIKVTNEPLNTALKQSFQNQPVDFSLQDKYIILHSRKDEIKSDFIDVSGDVKNDLGDPVAGATVAVMGSERATSTGTDGSFKLKQIPVTAVLVFSGANVEGSQVPLQGRRVLTIVLKTKIKKIDEVEVIAYGTTTRRLNTGDVSTVSAETIAEQPVSNPLAALEGRVAGLVVTQDNGIAGSTFHVQIRGQNSLRSGNDPLYIIDGVPFDSNPLTQVNQSTFKLSPFNSINPADIESMTVLKDADATAIYGSRGANGVILITTKKGKSGVTNLNINVYTGPGQITRKMPLLNTTEYLAMRHEAFNTDAYTPDPASDPDILVWDTTRYTDWQKTLIGNTMHSTDVQAGVSGGNEMTQFLISGNFHNETSVNPGDFADNRVGMHFNLSHVSRDKKLDLSFSSSFTVDRNNQPQQDIAQYKLYMAPDAPPVYDSSGKLNWAENTWVNPMAATLQLYNTQTDNLISALHISYFILKGLSVKAGMGYTQTWMNESVLYPQSSMNPANGSHSRAYFGNNQLKTWNIEPQLEYEVKAGPGRLDVLAGITILQTSNNGYAVNASGYSSDALLGSIAGASTLSTRNVTDDQYKYSAFFGRINYNIADEVILNFTGRRDGSSRFGPGKQFANFGSVAAAWIFSKTNFIQRVVPVLSFGKLRISYGTTGNDQIGNYQYLSSYSPVYYPYQNTSGLFPVNLANSDYSWEVNKKAEIGLDLGFNRDRILASVSYYRNRSSNQIVLSPLPGITGFSYITENLPAEVQNTGWEMELNASLIKTSSFNWKMNFNLSFPKNELVSFPDLQNSPYAGFYVVGQPLQIAKIYNLNGVNPQSGVYEFLDANGKPTSNPVYPDDTKPYDFSIKYYGGLGSGFQWHQWQLDFFIQFTEQPGALILPDFAPGQLSNQNTDVLNHWKQPGDRTSIQKLTATFGDTYTAYSYAQSELGLSDASFIRLKNVSFSYQFKPESLANIHLKSLRLYIQAQNLLTLTSYKGLDPESQGALPPIRLITGGLQLSL